jgi:lipoate-protein ligase A
VSFVDALDVIDDRELREPAVHMALDEALLRTATDPVLRFYRWRAPAASFGYFSRLEEVRQLSGERELVRRWTGGGIVMHGEDLTYSFVVPAAHSLCGKAAREIYAALHRAIASALARGGVNATLAISAAPRISDACFANPVQADVLIGSRKVAGAAQRRTRAGLLQQGSIQLHGLPQMFTDDFASAICATPRLAGISERCLSIATELARSKYATAAWLTRR